MEKPYRIGFTPLIDVPKKKKIHWENIFGVMFWVGFIILIGGGFVYAMRDITKEENKYNLLISECKEWRAIDPETCATCLRTSAIKDDKRCESVSRWNSK